MSKRRDSMHMILLIAMCAIAIPAAAKNAGVTAQLKPAEAVAGHCAAWNTIDRTKRDLLLEHVFARDGVYNDPAPTFVTGRAALSDEIASFQRHHRGARFRCSAPQTHHSAMRVSWVLVGARGKLVTQGMDFYELAPGGLIRRVTGFFGPPPVIDPDR